MRLSPTRLSLLIAVVLVTSGLAATLGSRRMERRGAELLAAANEASNAFVEGFQGAQQDREFELLDQRHTVLARAGALDAAGRFVFALSLLALGAAWLAFELTRKHEERPAPVPVPARVRSRPRHA